jgi:hypothetical protein
MTGTIFVLLAIDTTPDPAPNEIWVFPAGRGGELPEGSG